MSYRELKEQAWEANMGLARAGLVILTWGNASAIDRAAGVVAIKPSGVPYDQLAPERMILLSLEEGRAINDHGRPSSDWPTHLELYRSFPQIGGVVHAHSSEATGFAQAGREIPCLGTTHADHFYGTIPLTRMLNAVEVGESYELNTGRLIVETFRLRNLDPGLMPAVLVAGHAPFCWGSSAAKAVENAIALESSALFARLTLQLNPAAPPIPDWVLDKHFLRKHGPHAYYGQPARA